jgi:hypothetical protein
MFLLLLLSSIKIDFKIGWASDCCVTPIQQFLAISWREQVNCQWDDDEVRLDQHAEFGFYSASLLKQQSILKNRIGGVMDSVLASNAVDRGFEPLSGQNKDYKIGICCFSAKPAALRIINQANNKITELRAILQREIQNSSLYRQTKSVKNREICF